MSLAIPKPGAARRAIDLAGHQTLDRPIFIVGVGRSGSSIFYRMLAEHPNAAWLSYVSNWFPRRPRLLHHLLRASDWPLVGNLIQHKYGPAENYGFWETYRTGFSEPCRDLLAQDVTERDKRVLRQLLAQIPNRQRNRLLVKITGWPRVSFLHEIFPDAKFVHVQRDPRAVINSLLNVYFWSGWRGPQNWRWGQLTSEQMAEWERFDRSFVALAGIQMQILDDAMRRARQEVAPQNFMEVPYETFCDEPISTFREVVDFCELPWSPRFEQRLRAHRVRSADDKWQQRIDGWGNKRSSNILRGK